MFSQGEWISFEDVRERLDKIFDRILDPYFDGDMDRAYGSNFRSDIRIIRGSIAIKCPDLESVRFWNTNILQQTTRSWTEH